MNKELQINQLENVGAILKELYEKVTEVLEPYQDGVHGQVYEQLLRLMTRLAQTEANVDYACYIIDKYGK